MKPAMIFLLTIPFLLQGLVASSDRTECPSELTKAVSDCKVCPSASTLANVRKGKYPGVVKGKLVPHYSFSLNQLTTEISANIGLVSSVGIETCCDLCNKNINCEYWTWTQRQDSDTSNSGNCKLFNIDQCSFSDSLRTKLENIDDSDSMSYSSQRCDGGSSSPTPSPPPPVGVTTSPPPFKAPPPPGVKGDPHFAGWDGVHFDFTGRPGQSYCLLTDNQVHVNMYLEGYNSKVNGTEDVHTWIKGMGIMSGDHKLALYARSGKEAERGEGYMKRMVADGKEFTLAENESLTIGSGNGTVRIEYKGHRMDADDDIDVYEVQVAASIKFLLKMRPEVPVMRLPDNAWVHFSMEVLEENLSDTPHGILGQTLWNLHNPEQAPEGYSVQYSGILWAWQVAGRDGDQYIQGKPRDYLTSDVLAADCKYGKLDGAEKKPLGVFSVGCNRKALIC